MEVLKALKNMKSFLVTLLTVAMVFGSVPSVAFGAEDVSGNEPGTAETEVEDAALGEVVEDITDEPMDALNDMDIWFNNVGDLNPVSQNIAVYDLAKVKADPQNKTAFTNDPSVSYNGNDGHMQDADSDLAYSFIVEPMAGYKIKDTQVEKIVKSISFNSYTSKTDPGTEQTLTADDKEGYWLITDVDSDVKAFFNKGSKMVTLTKKTMKEVYDAGEKAASGRPARIITIDFDGDITEKAELYVPIIAADDKVKLDNKAKEEFKRSITDEAQVSLSQNVINFAKYDVSGNDSKFLAVVVKDENDQVIDDYTKKVKDHKILIIANDSNDHDYETVTAGEFDVGSNIALAKENLKNKKWVAYVAKSGNKKLDDGTGDMLYAGNVIISQQALAAIYYAGYTVSIVVSGEGTDTGEYGVTYTDKDAGFVKYSLSSNGTGTAPSTVDAAGPLEFSVQLKDASSHAGRKLSNVWYKQGDGDWTKDHLTITPSANGAHDVVISTSFNKAVSIKTDATEDLAVAGSGNDKIRVFSLGGIELPTTPSTNAAKRAIDGEAYKFFVVGRDNYTVGNVDVNMSMGSGKERVTPVDYIYTTPSNVENKIDIYSTTGETSGVKYTASLTTAIPGVAVNSLDDGDTTISNNSTNKTAEEGKPFYFTVKKADNDDTIDNVSCKVGTGTSDTLKPIAVKKDDDGDTYFYVTKGLVTGNVSITIAYSGSTAVRKVYAAQNDKAKFSFAKAGASVDAGLNSLFEFTVAPANLETTEIVEVGYYTVSSSEAPHKAKEYDTEDTLNDNYEILGFEAGDYSFKVEADADEDIVVYAVTEEAVARDTYRIEFNDGASENDRVKSTFTTDDKTKQDINTLDSQSLELVLTTGETNLGYTKVYTKDKISGKFDKDSAVSYNKASLAGLHPSLVFDLENDSNTVTITGVGTKDDQLYKITPHSVGTDKLNAEFIVDEGKGETDRGQLNRLVYTADLPVTVKDLFSDLQIATTTSSFYPFKLKSLDEFAALTIVGTDAQTGEPVDLYVDGYDIKEINWYFEPGIDEIPEGVRDYGFMTFDEEDKVHYASEIKNGINHSDPATAAVIAKKPLEESIQVKATITFGENYKNLPDKVVGPITLNCVKKPDYPFFFVTKTSGARVIGNYIDTYDFHGSATGVIDLGLADNDEKSVNIDYEVYQILDDIGFKKVSKGGFKRDVTTVDQLQEALDKGYIKKATQNVEFDGARVGLFDGNTEKPNVADYVTFTEGNTKGSYKVTAKKETPTGLHVKLLAPTMTVNGVAVDNLNLPSADEDDTPRKDQVKIAVIKRQVKQKVDLVLYDSVKKEVSGKDTYVVTEQKLSDDYIASRPYSIVKSSNAEKNKEKGAWTYGKVTGVEFTQVPKYSSFVLPAAEDFATTASGNRILVGWQETATPEDGVAGAGTKKYYKPGDHVEITGDATYKAIWADKYGISDITNGNMVTIGKDDYDETITNQKQYKTPLSGNIAVNGVIPVVLRVSEAYSVETDPAKASTDPKDSIKLKSKYITTGFTITNKTNTDAIEIGQDAAGRPTITGKKKLETAGAVIVASWESEKGTITAETDKIYVKEFGTFKVALNKNQIALEAGQDPETAAATVYSKLTIEDAGTDKVIDGSTTNPWGVYAPGDYNDPAIYSLTWSNASEADAAYATAKTGFDAKPEATTAKLTNYVSALQATTEPVTLTLTAANIYGQKWTADLKVTVNSPKVSFKVYKNNKAKTELTDGKVEVFASVSSNKLESKYLNDTNSFLIKAFDENDKDITNTGTWTVEIPKDPVTGLNKVFDDSEDPKLTSIGDGTGYKVATFKTNNSVEEDKLKVKFEISSVKYVKEIPVSTCYAVALYGNPLHTSSKKNIYVTDNGNKVVDKDGYPDVAYIRLGVNDKVMAEEGTGFSFNNISLAAYSAEYVNTDTNPDTQTFDYWEDGTQTESYGTAIESLNKNDFYPTTSGTVFPLDPVMVPDATLTGVPGEVTLTHNLPGETRLKRSYDLEIEPGTYPLGSIYVRSDAVGFYTANGSGTGNDKISVSPNKTNTRKTGTLLLAKVGSSPRDWQAGKATLNFYATEKSTKVLGTTTLFVDGLDCEELENGKIIRTYYERGEKVKSTMRTVYDNGASTTYYFDVSGNQITGSGVYDIDGKKVLILTGNVAQQGVQVFESKEYFVEGLAGEIAVAKLVTVKDKDGKEIPRYANEDGVLVTYAMTVEKGTPGKWSDKGGAYLIEEGTNAAKADHTEHTWTYKSMDWTGYNFQTASGNAVAVFVCEKGQETGTAPAEVKAESKKVENAEQPELGYTVWKYTATATKNPDGKDITAQKDIVYKQFKGGAWMDATEKDWKAAGGSGESGESKNPGQTESEPAQSDIPTFQSFNLFYKDQRTIPVPGLSDALGDATTLSGKAGEYFDVDGDSVKVKDSLDYKKIKKAVNASNSLIKEGSFTYQLPVYYQKPTLKLTSAKGTRKKGDSAVVFFKTQITEKKSSGNYEPIALDASAITADSKLSAALAVPDGAESAITTDETTVSIATKQKGSGKLLVQALDDDKKPAWAEPIKLSYSVAESSKDIIVVSSKKINMNAKATGENLEGEKVTVTFNGSEEFEGVKADLTKLPSTSGVLVNGIDESGNVGHELTFEYAEGGAKKGSYKVVLQGGNSAKVTITVKVADSDLSKAVSLTVRSQMDVTKKQKMVLIPKLKTVGGVINQEVKVSDTNLVAEYYADSNKIVVGPVDDNDWSKLSANNNYQATFTVNVAGIECPVGIKTKINAKTPTVKMGAVTFPKSSLTEETPLTGETNVLATYKQGGKTFSVEPDVDKDGNAMVTFVNGGTADTDGWYTDSKTNTKVKYEDGVIKVQPTAQSKKGSVKVTITFPGGAVAKNKSFKIAIDKNK